MNCIMIALYDLGVVYEQTNSVRRIIIRIFRLKQVLLIMCSLSLQQKEAVFDYSFGLTAEQEANQVEALIVHNKEAAVINSKLKAVLASLDTLRSELCPDDLIQRSF